MINMLLALLASYLAGSVPTAYLAGRLLKGIDIRQHGSGNVGATNTFRVLGRGPGLFVLGIDILKGILPITVFADFFGCTSLGMRILLGVAAVIGHNWTVFLRFQGGKGIATSLGVLIGLTAVIPSLRTVVMTCVLVWAAVFLTSGYVSLASMTAAVVLPLAAALAGLPPLMVIFSLFICLFVILRHRANIRRLLDGRERRVTLPYLKK